MGKEQILRELSNLINAKKEAKANKLLEKVKLFMFTDNNTAGSAFFFELVLNLRNPEMNSGLIVHLIHVAAQRMIDQGTDGLS